MAGAASVAGDSCGAQRGLRRWLCMATFNIPDRREENVLLRPRLATRRRAVVQIEGLRCTQILIVEFRTLLNCVVRLKAVPFLPSHTSVWWTLSAVNTRGPVRVYTPSADTMHSAPSVVC